MAFIDKLLNKFNKVKRAVNSLKGIQAKIQAINYTTAIDALGEEKSAAEDMLKVRRESLKESLGATNVAGNYSKKQPIVDGTSVVYPTYDQLTNYIVFVSRPRRAREAGASLPVHTRRQVALYVPDALISQSSVTYQADSPNPVARALSAAVDTFAKTDGSWGDAWNAGAEQANKLGTKFIQQTLNTMTGGFSNLRHGRAINPMQEQMLNGIPFRSWDFTFDFWPKSTEERDNVNEIIYIFRSSMLPDTYSDKTRVSRNKDGDASILKGNLLNKDIESSRDSIEVNPSYFNYPNVFEIYFHGPLGSKIDGFLPAVCTNAQVDYTGGQKFSTFADGQPVHIQLTLNFLEIKVMSLGNYESIRGGMGNKGQGDDSINMSIVDRASRGDFSDDPSESPPGT